MGMASMSLSTIGNSQVVSIVSRIIEDLVRGKLVWSHEQCLGLQLHFLCILPVVRTDFNRSV